MGIAFPIATTMPISQSSETERVQSLRQARQRIVELLELRTYLKESDKPGPLLADVEAMLAQALALECSLIAQARPRRSLRARVARALTGLLFLGSLADDAAVGALELAFNALPY